jgi:hypothetical protein
MRAHAAILDAWIEKTVQIYPEQARNSIARGGERFRNPVGFTVRESLAKLLQELAGEMDAARTTEALDGLVRLPHRRNGVDDLRSVREVPRRSGPGPNQRSQTGAQRPATYEGWPVNALYALLAVAALIGAGLLAGSSTLTGTLLAVAVPYAACAILLAGICARLWRWAATPVPFRIPTTCGQQRSLDWIKPATFDNPSTGMGAAARMALEVLLFRSLFRNTRSKVAEGKV